VKVTKVGDLVKDKTGRIGVVMGVSQDAAENDVHQIWVRWLPGWDWNLGYSDDVGVISESR